MKNAITFILLGFTGYGVYKFICFLCLQFPSFWQWVLGGREFDGRIVAAIITAFVVIFTTWYVQHHAMLRDIYNAHRSHKQTMYKNFIDNCIIKLFEASKDNHLNNPAFKKQLEKSMFSFTGDIIVWGSPEVIRAYSALKTNNPEKIFLHIDNMLQTIRQDLGNSRLNQGELLKLFVSDPENLKI